MDEKSLSHTSWNCKYHIVLVPKYRRKVIYGKLRKDIGKILRMLCDYKHVEIIEAHAMPDHIHMLLSIPPKLAVADFMGYLKGKSTLMIFERHANLKYKYGRRVFWAKGYYVNRNPDHSAASREFRPHGAKGSCSCAPPDAGRGFRWSARPPAWFFRPRWCAPRY